MLVQVVLYRPNSGRGCNVADSPPSLPEQGADAIYSFESLPEKHWKKYLYASRCVKSYYLKMFVNLVKAKTPKITFYSNKAKCLLMENDPDPDFEVCFYEGGKITKSSNEGIKIINSNGHSTVLKNSSEASSLRADAHILWDHFEQCYQHCLLLEKTLTQLSNDTPVKDANCFPVIVGRRPSSSLPPVFGGKENVTNIQDGKKMLPVPMMPSFDISVLSTNHQSPEPFGQDLRRNRKFSPVPSAAPSVKEEKRVHVPGIGWATHIKWFIQSGLRVFSNKILKKIFGAKRDEVTGEWRKLHNAELHALYSSPDIIRNIKSRRLNICVASISDKNFFFFQLPSGEIRVQFDDGSEVTINTHSDGVQVQNADGQLKKYNQKDMLPSDLKIKLAQFPKIVRYLMQTDVKAQTPTPASRTRAVR
ncbi:hypothetical protein ANN_17522 [Periplaneta americana]|uniref:Polo kinase n=1 Tax=Periplaneta americana TaxID=6978 RepID=A0ABQ8ST66_PERAM|nr:hypothetical protein ANN_17522 [Periplaneta americana]